MSAVTIVAVSALLAGLFLLIVAVMAWQEGSRRGGPVEAAYVINDAVDYAVSQLPPEALERLGTSGVKRIIEWSAFYLQGLADRKAARRGISVVAGGDERAVEYIQRELARRSHHYAKDDIRAVLNEEGRYLASIGVVGDPVDEDELA